MKFLISILVLLSSSCLVLSVPVQTNELSILEYIQIRKFMFLYNDFHEILIKKKAITLMYSVYWVT